MDEISRDTPRPRARIKRIKKTKWKGEPVAKSKGSEGKPAPPTAPALTVALAKLSKQWTRVSQAEIRQQLGIKVRELFERAIADPSSDAYTMIEILCVNELVDADLKVREMDLMELLRARNQAKDLAIKEARLQRQNKLYEARTRKVGLEIEKLTNTIAEVRREASEANKLGRPFDYERALNQISAVIGLRGPEVFRYEEQAPKDN